ncbi:hypothetical protein [Pseudomonas sp. BF-R-24]|uniref:hypothetical protein n=1 Tax=Pseudomonas sp. BF-R-24 TaxID=2832386 RepID=UPI001CC0BBAE|nr:hypothetical protein [Pseudomonas sp. BF-R-24]
MIGVPMPHPRDSIIETLNQQLEHYFGAGKSVQEIEPGVTGEKALGFGSAHSNKLRAGRDKIAPVLKTMAESGSSLNKAAEALGIDHKRARLIASENSFKFKS